MNNTNKTHQFVDMVAKITADKGVSFDFTNNERLKDSGFALKGKTVNGYVTPDGVTVNVNSAKALNSVVGHEITHVLEGTELYDSLQSVLFEYAKSKGEYQTRLDTLTKLYEGVKGADVTAELTADLVGDYIFADADFVRNLSTQHRNVFQKVFDEIKYLYKTATAGSAEARQLEKAKKLFEDIYRESEATKNTATEDGVRYSLSYNDAIDRLHAGTLDRIQNTHLKLLDHTPQVYIDKAGAKDLKIVAGWDIAYLAMNKEGDIPGNYHGLGPDVMKQIPQALQDPLYIVKQGNGRIVAVTEIVVKGKRSTIVSMELDTFKSTTQDGSNESDNYNLIVTFLDAKPNYLQNTIFSGDVVYNKNNEDPAHFILRLKSLNKALPNDDLAKSSKNSISNPTENVNRENSLSSETDNFPIRDGIYGKDIALEFDDDIPIRDDIKPVQAETTTEAVDPPMQEDLELATVNEHISMKDFSNRESEVWRNVDYADAETKAKITQETHRNMVESGSVVHISQEVVEKVEQSFPDLRSVKKKERTPILKEAISKLKNDLRQFLNGFKNQGFEFEVSGRVLEAKLYNTGINEVLEKVTQEKANMLYTTEGIFRNAQYLYSTPDYDGDPNVYRWNYFYTPVQIGEDVVGVRIAVRDIAEGQDHIPESQIYNWNIKKDASLGGVQPVVSDSSHGASSDASIDSIPENVPDVNMEGVPIREEIKTAEKVANVLVNEPKVAKKKNSVWSLVKEYVLDNGMVFEDISKKTKNRNLEAKWNFVRYSRGMAQYLMENGASGVKSLDSVRKAVEAGGKTQHSCDSSPCTGEPLLLKKRLYRRLSLYSLFQNNDPK